MKSEGAESLDDGGRRKDRSVPQQALLPYTSSKGLSHQIQLIIKLFVVPQWPNTPLGFWSQAFTASPCSLQITFSRLGSIILQIESSSGTTLYHDTSVATGKSMRSGSLGLRRWTSDTTSIPDPK